MDPQATWDALLQAVAVEQSTEASELAEALDAWLRRDGFPPLALPGIPRTSPLHRVVVATVCEQVLRAAVDIQPE